MIFLTETKCKISLISPLIMIMISPLIIGIYKIKLQKSGVKNGWKLVPLKLSIFFLYFPYPKVLDFQMF